MAHYAYLDKNNIVVDVIVGKDETDTSHDWEDYYAQGTPYTVKRTSYNGNIRYNYAGIGYTYDPVDDAFIAPMPQCGHEELLLNDLKRWECSNDEHKATFIEVSDPA
jgi:hypothetical protein